MSNRLLNMAWEVQRLSLVEKFVLVSLADRADDESGKCFPGMKDHKLRTLASKRSIDRAIRALESDGHISVQRRTGLPSIYTVHPRHSGTGVTAAPASASHLTPVTVAPHPRHSGTLTPINPMNRSVLSEPRPAARRKAKKASTKKFNGSPTQEMTAFWEEWQGGAGFSPDELDAKRERLLDIERLSQPGSDERGLARQLRAKIDRHFHALATADRRRIETKQGGPHGE